MLRRSCAAFLDVGEVSSIVMGEYILSSDFVQDLLGALCSVDQALFRYGLRQPMRLLLVANYTLGRRIVTKFCQSLIVGCFCASSSTLLHSSVDYYFTNSRFQEVVFGGFVVARLLRAVGRFVIPKRFQRIGTFLAQEMEPDEHAKLAYSVGFRERMVTEGTTIPAAVVAANLVTDAASIAADQLEWARIYYNEVYLKWKNDTTVDVADGSKHVLLGSLLRRTIKGHLASTIMSFVEIGLEWGVRMLGKAVAKKIFRQHSINSVPSFWVEHLLLCLSAPILGRLAHLSAAMTYYVIETYVLPQTEGESKVQDEEEAAEKDEEGEQREQYNAAHNTNDLYAALGVESSASSADIKKAYRQKALQYHPDRFSHMQAAEREAAQEAMPVINEAYEILSSDAKRTAYDASRTLAGSPFDPDKPHPLAVRFLKLPFPVQVVSGVTVLTSMAWAGGLVFSAHVKNHFIGLTQAGRAPIRHMCGAA